MDLIVHGFITDSVFYNKQNIDLNGSVDTGIGYLNDKRINYFDKISRINDSRENRLSILGEPVSDKYLAILFDKNKQLDISVFEGLTGAQQIKLFNILETIYLTQNRTEKEIDVILTGSTNEYDIYVQESVKISNKKVDASITLGTATTIKVPEWIEFTIDTNGHLLKFHLWLVSESFEKNYPLTTISKVVPPCDPANLLDPSKFANTIDTLVQSNIFSFTMIDSDMKHKDHTGMLTHRTKYVTSTYDVHQLPFGILYKGAKPSTLEMRKAIREYLIGLGITSESNWKTLFPDLFVTGQFFIVPIWDNITIRPDRTIFPSVVNYNKIFTKVSTIYANIESSFITKYTEIIVNGYTELFSAILPDALNDSQFSFQKAHPTYVYHNSQSPGFEYQEEKTKEFNTKFNNCMAVATGNSTSSEFNSNIFNDREYLSFVVDGIEFHLLTKAGYEHG